MIPAGGMRKSPVDISAGRGLELTDCGIVSMTGEL